MSQKASFPTACKTCRRRGKKCDRTLPSCMSCTQRGVPCEGYVTRWVGVAARGKLAGETLPNSRKKESKRLRQSSSAQLTSHLTAEASRNPEDVASSTPESIHTTVPLPAGDHQGSACRKHENAVDNNSPPTTVRHRYWFLTAQQRAPRICINALPDADNLQDLIRYCK